jgi:hypothetical protein
MISPTRVAAAEVLKLRSIRSYRLTVLGAALSVVALAGIMAAVSGSGATAWDAQPVALPLEYFAYVMMIIGVLLVTGDIASGTAAITGSLVPWRSRVVLGKYLAGGGVALAAALVVGAAVLVADGVGTRTGLDTLFSGEALAVTLSGLAAVPVAAVIGVAFGMLLRFTSSAVSLLLVWSFLLETILVFIVPERFGAFLPFKTFGGSRLLLDELGAVEGLAVFSLYAAALVVLAAFVESRRDVPVA